MSAESPEQTFFWFFHNGDECDPGDVHPQDHGREKTFEEAVEKVKSFKKMWKNM